MITWVLDQYYRPISDYLLLFITLITTDDILFYSFALNIKSFLFHYFQLGWQSVLTSKLRLRRRWFELLDSPRSGVYYIARLGVDHHWCVELGIWLGRRCVFSQAEDYLSFAAFVISEVGSCLATCATKACGFFSLLKSTRCDAFYSIPFYEKSKRSSAVDSSYATCACIAWFLALFPPLDVTVGSACVLFSLFFFLYFALKDNLDSQMTSAVSVAPSFFILFFFHRCNATSPRQRMQHVTYTLIRHLFLSTLYTISYLFLHEHISPWEFIGWWVLFPFISIVTVYTYEHVHA